MQITEKAWVEYITKMSQISQKAADLMQSWVQKNGLENDKALLDYAYALSQHYGQAIGALSCQMYEATAAAQGVIVPTAEVADLPDYGEVAKAVKGTKKQSPNNIPGTLARLVKQVGADTTSENKTSVTMDSMSAKSIGVDGIQVTGSDSTNADKAVDTISDAIYYCNINSIMLLFQ